jgi:Phospholipase_D-nuclease N-terminal
VPDIVGGLIGIGFLVLWIYCIYDVITTDDAIVRNLPKLVWLIIVIMVPDIGSILWLGLGRPQVWTRQAHDPQRYGSSRLRPSPSPALDTDAMDHLSPIVRHREEQTRLHLWEAQLKRREEELRRRELGDGSAP